MKTKEKIKLESINLFSEKSYDKTSLSMIAKEVGITKSTIYSHYSSKDDLYLDIIDHIAYKNIVLVNEIFSSNSKEIENLLYSAYITFSNLWSNHQKKETKIYNNAILFPPDSIKEIIYRKIYECERHFLNTVKNIFEKAKQLNITTNEIDVLSLSLSYMNLINGNTIQYEFLSKEEFDIMVEKNWYIYWRGITK